MKEILLFVGGCVLLVIGLNLVNILFINKYINKKIKEEQRKESCVEIDILLDD